jgi:DNA-binding LacI/PurR family transcriptional regulator
VIIGSEIGLELGPEAGGLQTRTRAVPENNGVPGRRPTIRDVAERAGVSKSLVSLVMRGEPMVREDKRRRVQQAAEELGYRPNFAARSLSAVKSKTVGVLVADMRNPLLIDVVEHAEQFLYGVGLGTLLTSAVSRTLAGPRIDEAAIGALKDLRVEGILVVGSVPDRAALAEALGDVPVVVAAAQAEGLRADVVRNDDRLGMRLVVDHLVAGGHRNIAHLGGLGGGVAEERAAGYLAAMGHHGLDNLSVIADADFTEDRGYRGAVQLLHRSERVTAITAVNDLAAVGALSAAADSGIDVPGDLALTGYDDTFVAAIRAVSLTSVNPDSSGIGMLAAQSLVDRIGSPDKVYEEHLLPPRLVTRSSSLAPRAARRGGTRPV